MAKLLDLETKEYEDYLLASNKEDFIKNLL